MGARGNGPLVRNMKATLGTLLNGNDEILGTMEALQRSSSSFIVWHTVQCFPFPAGSSMSSSPMLFLDCVRKLGRKGLNGDTRENEDDESSSFDVPVVVEAVVMDGFELSRRCDSGLGVVVGGCVENW